MIDEVELVLINVPHDAPEMAIREDIILGPPSEEFVLLIEVDPQTGGMALTIGNGPPDPDVPNVIPSVLREIADIVESLTITE